MQFPSHPDLEVQVTSLAPNSCCSYGFPRTQLLQFFAARSTQHFWHSSQMICGGIFPMRHCPMISFFWNQRGQISSKFHQCSTTATLLPYAMSRGYALPIRSVFTCGKQRRLSFGCSFTALELLSHTNLLFLYSLEFSLLLLANPLLLQSHNNQ